MNQEQLLAAILVGIIAATPPTLGAFAVLRKLRRETTTREQDRHEVTVALQTTTREIKRDLAEVHVLVNHKADESKAEIVALKLEVARLNRDRGATTPIITAGEGAPSEVGIDHGVVTAERIGPFPQKPNADKGS